MDIKFIPGLKSVQDFALMAALFIITALTIFPYFFGDFTQNFGSIESAYISDSVFIANSFPNVGWYPFWYGGFPFHLSYPPLFVTLVTILHFASGFSIGQSYRILGGVAYSAAPVALFLLSKVLTRDRIGSFFAGLTYAFVPTFLPSIAPPRVDVLALYGEAPHLFGFALALLSIIQLSQYISKPTWHRWASASFLIAGVALSNLIALYGLALLMIAAVLTEFMFRSRNALLLTLLVGGIAYGLCAFQYDPRFIQSSAQFAGSGGIRFHPAEIVGLVATGVSMFLLRRHASRYFARHNQFKVVFFYVAWIAIFFLVIAGGQNWFGLPTIAPQSGRYMPELDAGLSLFAGLLVTTGDQLILRFLARTQSLVRLCSRGVMIAALFSILLIVSALSLPHAIAVTQPTTNLNNVPEYQVATWLSQHVTDESVFATGTVCFWLDVFSNVRQIRGGSDQGSTNPWWTDVAYQINAGADPKISILLAEAWNVRYIVVTFPNASTAYHDYIYPMKFVNVLPLVYYVAGNAVYEVPLLRPALVEPVDAMAALALTPIHDVLDQVSLSRYVNLTQISSNDSGAQVTYTSSNPDSYRISVSDASEDTAILVKMTYDTGWHARLNRKELEVSPIGLDFMILYPQTQGSYSIDLDFEPSLGQNVGLAITIITLGLVTAISLVDLRITRHNVALKNASGAISNSVRDPRAEPKPFFPAG